MTREQQAAVLDRVKSWPSEQLEEAIEILLALESRAKGIYRLSDGPSGLGIHDARRSKPMLQLEAHDRVMGALPKEGALLLVIRHLQANVCECGV